MSVHAGQSSGDGYEQEVKVNIVSQSFPDDQKTVGFWGSVLSTHTGTKCLNHHGSQHCWVHWRLASSRIPANVD